MSKPGPNDSSVSPGKENDSQITHIGLKNQDLLFSYPNTERETRPPSFKVGKESNSFKMTPKFSQKESNLNDIDKVSKCKPFKATNHADGLLIELMKGQPVLQYSRRPHQSFQSRTPQPSPITTTYQPLSTPHQNSQIDTLFGQTPRSLQYNPSPHPPSLSLSPSLTLSLTLPSPNTTSNTSNPTSSTSLYLSPQREGLFLASPPPLPSLLVYGSYQGEDIAILAPIDREGGEFEGEGWVVLGGGGTGEGLRVGFQQGKITTIRDIVSADTFSETFLDTLLNKENNPPSLYFCLMFLWSCPIKSILSPKNLHKLFSHHPEVPPKMSEDLIRDLSPFLDFSQGSKKGLLNSNKSNHLLKEIPPFNICFLSQSENKIPSDDDEEEGSCKKTRSLGSMFKSNGSSFHGQFEMTQQGAKIEGLGGCISDEGANMVGFFKDNRLDRVGGCTLGGDCYAGLFKQGLFHGPGVYFAKDGGSSGIWSSGLYQDGELVKNEIEVEYCDHFLTAENRRLNTPRGFSKSGTGREVLDLIHNKDLASFFCKPEFTDMSSLERIQSKSYLQNIKFPEARRLLFQTRLLREPFLSLQPVEIEPTVPKSALIQTKKESSSSQMPPYSAALPFPADITSQLIREDPQEAGNRFSREQTLREAKEGLPSRLNKAPQTVFEEIKPQRSVSPNNKVLVGSLEASKKYKDADKISTVRTFKTFEDKTISKTDPLSQEMSKRDQFSQGSMQDLSHMRLPLRRLGPVESSQSFLEEEKKSHPSTNKKQTEGKSPRTCSDIKLMDSARSDVYKVPKEEQGSDFEFKLNSLDSRKDLSSISSKNLLKGTSEGSEKKLSLASLEKNQQEEKERATTSAKELQIFEEQKEHLIKERPKEKREEAVEGQKFSKPNSVSFNCCLPSGQLTSRGEEGATTERFRVSNPSRKTVSGEGSKVSSVFGSLKGILSTREPIEEYQENEEEEEQQSEDEKERVPIEQQVEDLEAEEALERYNRDPPSATVTELLEEEFVSQEKSSKQQSQNTPQTPENKPQSIETPTNQTPVPPLNLKASSRPIQTENSDFMKALIANRKWEKKYSQRRSSARASSGRSSISPHRTISPGRSRSPKVPPLRGIPQQPFFFMDHKDDKVVDPHKQQLVQESYNLRPPPTLSPPSENQQIPKFGAHDQNNLEDPSLGPSPRLQNHLFRDGLHSKPADICLASPELHQDKGHLNQPIFPSQDLSKALQKDFDSADSRYDSDYYYDRCPELFSSKRNRKTSQEDYHLIRPGQVPRLDFSKEGAPKPYKF